MSRTILKITTDKKRFLPLLLLADESESMIDRYLERGNVYALFRRDGPTTENTLCPEDVISMCVVTDEGSGMCEIKNLVTSVKYRGRGHASELLRHVSLLYRESGYSRMRLGTGETPSILRFYHRNGFRYSNRIVDFFTDNYPDPIIEDGVLLKDMIYLEKEL